MIETRLRDVRPVAGTSTELAQHPSTIEIIGDVAPPRSMRRTTQPLENRLRLTLPDGGEVLHPGGHCVGAELRGDPSGQRIFRMAQCRTHKQRGALIAGQHIVMLIEPNPRRPDERIGAEGHFGRNDRSCAVRPRSACSTRCQNLSAVMATR